MENPTNINYVGKSENSQIQQGDNNSIQIQSMNKEFDYEKISETLDEIKEYKYMFEEVYGEKSKLAERALNDAIERTTNKDKPSKIKSALTILKDLSLRVSSSVIATEILEIIKKIKL